MDQRIIDQTEALKRFLEEECDMDVYGFCSAEALNKRERPGRRPCDIWPEAKSLIFFGVGQADQLSKSWCQEALVGDIVAITINELAIRSLKICRYIRQQGEKAYYVRVHGDGPLAVGTRLADVGEEAGVGYIGKNSMLITDKYGPRINLAVVPTTMELVYNEEKIESRCGNCTMCQKVCTSGAIMGPQQFHPRQCESTVNAKPAQLRYSRMGWHDCDMCYRMCPQGTWQWEKSEKDMSWWNLVEKNRENPLSKYSVFGEKDYAGGVKM